jgi:hypothetical protein
VTWKREGRRYGNGKAGEMMTKSEGRNGEEASPANAIISLSIGMYNENNGSIKESQRKETFSLAYLYSGIWQNIAL